MPERSRPTFFAAPRLRSMIRLLMKGPRSFIRTMTDLPVLTTITRTFVPNGRLRCAAVRPFGLKSLAAGGELAGLVVGGKPGLRLRIRHPSHSRDPQKQSGQQIHTPTFHYGHCTRHAGPHPWKLFQIFRSVRQLPPKRRNAPYVNGFHSGWWRGLRLLLRQGQQPAGQTASNREPQTLGGVALDRGGVKRAPQRPTWPSGRRR